jgi:hypothetical protein
MLTIDAQVREVAVARRAELREEIRTAIEHKLLSHGPLADEDVLTDPFVGLAISLAVDSVVGATMRVWSLRLERESRIGNFTIMSGGKAS